MGHLIRIRDIIQSVSEKTTWDISAKRKEQLLKAIERAEKIQADLEEMSKAKGLLGILARAILLNLQDYIAVLKGTRFTKPAGG